MLENTSRDLVIKDISWERVFLHVEIESLINDELDFYLCNFHRKKFKYTADSIEENFGRCVRDNKVEARINNNSHLSESELKILLNKHYSITETILDKCIKIDNVECDGSTYKLTLNVPALDGNKFLDNGRWQIRALKKSSGKDMEESISCGLTNEIAYRLEDFSRIFRYGGGKYAYNMSFSTFETQDNELCFVINSYFMIENRRWKKRRYVQEALTKKGKLKRFRLYVVIKLIRGYYQVVEHIFPKKKNRIMFMTETKDFLWGNLKYIDDRIKERKLNDKFKITYSLRKAVGNRKSVLSWFILINKIAMQDFIFVDDYVPIFGFLDLNKRTKLIQVWHAGEGFKAVGYCRFGKVGTPFPTGSCHRKYDYVVTGSNKLVHIFEEVFGLPRDNFFPLGMARLDGFLNEEKISEFRDEFYSAYPKFKDKKIILFAPTYRGKGQKTAYYDYDMLDQKQIYDFCGEEYIWAYKMHPFISKDVSIPEEFADRIIDLSHWENINDLYYVTELLITDYSSNYFEYALMKKPVLFFTYDRERYELTRGVHRPVKESAPGKVCDSFDEMMTALYNKDFEEYKIEEFVKENFSEYDGKAADKIIDRILLGGKTDE